MGLSEWGRLLTGPFETADTALGIRFALADRLAGHFSCVLDHFHAQRRNPIEAHAASTRAGRIYSALCSGEVIPSYVPGGCRRIPLQPALELAVADP